MGHVISIHPGATVHVAACVMTRANCGSVLIIDTHSALLGILTERDLMTRVLAKGVNPAVATARDVMTPKPTCVLPETMVSEAVVIMLERGFRHLPIVNAQGRILGVFSIRDALPREIGAAMTPTMKDGISDGLSEGMAQSMEDAMAFAEEGLAAGLGGGLGGPLEEFPPVEPVDLGPDPVLDAYAQDCFDGDLQACDDLFYQSPPLSEYESYGSTCGGRVKQYAVMACTELE